MKFRKIAMHIPHATAFSVLKIKIPLKIPETIKNDDKQPVINKCFVLLDA